MRWTDVPRRRRGHAPPAALADSSGGILVVGSAGLIDRQQGAAPGADIGAGWFASVALTGPVDPCCRGQRGGWCGEDWSGKATGRAASWRPNARCAWVPRITTLSTNPAAAETAASVGPDGPARLRHNSPAKTPARTLLMTTIIAGADSHPRVGSPGGISPPGSLRTERDSLPSLRSCHLDHQGVPDPRPVGEVAGELRGDAVPGCAGLPVGT
jgi:hypothetical protein